MSNSNPIVITGAGRSGTTILHKYLIRNSNLYWFSSQLEKYPKKLSRNTFINKMCDIPFINSLVYNNISPSEAYGYLEYLHKGTRRPFRNLVDADVIPYYKQKVEKELLSEISLINKQLIIKITGWPRIAFMSKLFNTKNFIIVDRDPRATINSLIKVGWWRGWEGPHNWRFGLLNETEQEILSQNNNSFIALAAIELMKLYKTVEHTLIESDYNIYRVQYEDFIKRPEIICANIFKHYEIPITEQFCKLIKKIKIYQTSIEKWKWSRLQINILIRVLLI